MKILVWLSGGVDSAVTALLLKQQWHEVIGGFMINYSEPENPRCTTRQDLREAKKVAEFLEIPLLTFNFQKEYKQHIIDYIIDGYKQWITPNPDVFCNNLIKFDLFLEEALELGCNKMATGHYAKIEYEKGRTNGASLLRWIDTTKDQSYFLSGLNQHQLSKALFPLGDLTKKEIRTIASEAGLPNADRPDSQGLCFIGNVSIKDFLQNYLPTKRGDILDTKGNKVGEHDGAYAFTIGQKKGLWLNFKAYVVSTDITKNTITITDNKEDPALYSTWVEIKNRHRIQHPTSNFSPLTISYKIRYRQDPQPGKLSLTKENEVQIIFDSPVRAVPPGQIAVAYDDDVVIGSGIISQIM